MTPRTQNILSMIADHAGRLNDLDRALASWKMPPMIRAIVDNLISLSRDDLRPSRIIIRPGVLIELRKEAQGSFAGYITPDPDEPLCSRFLNLPLTPVSGVELGERAWTILTRN